MAKRDDAILKIADLASEIQKNNLWQWVRFHSGERQYSPDTILLNVKKDRGNGVGKISLTYSDSMED